MRSMVQRVRERIIFSDFLILSGCSSVAITHNNTLHDNNNGKCALAAVCVARGFACTLGAELSEVARCGASGAADIQHQESQTPFDLGLRNETQNLHKRARAGGLFPLWEMLRRHRCCEWRHPILHHLKDCSITSRRLFTLEMTIFALCHRQRFLYIFMTTKNGS